MTLGLSKLPIDCNWWIKSEGSLTDVDKEYGPWLKASPWYRARNSVVEVQIELISQFISQMSAKSDPIFKLLKKHDSGEWTEKCQMAFDVVKDYLSTPPILVPPILEKPFILYLTIYEKSMGSVLGQHDEIGKNEHAIYYLSKKFTEYKSKYPSMEKMCCALA